SKKNMFTPAQTKENMVKTPVFRLLGPDPVHNYDNEKYILSDGDRAVLYTLEPAWTSARRKDVVEWYDTTYYKNESLSFSCVQIGQENSFFEVGEKMLEALEMQIEVFKSDPEVKFMTTGEMGRRFKESFAMTPAESVFASEDWSAGEKVQSLYYNCKNYMANLFRFEDRIFFRSIYLFDENVEEKYLSDPCETAYVAIYENLPVCDTVNWKDNSGFELDKNACKFDVKKNDDGSLTAFWNDKSVTFTQEKIVLKNVSPVLDVALSNAEISASDNVLEYKKDGAEYSVKVIGAQITLDENTVAFSSGENVELAFC
ncbi:MAG: hypothetical protein IJU39_03220, partial [Clostridia bacterium]|nr:hypothetical protein [Clostridia bacterium]